MLEAEGAVPPPGPQPQAAPEPLAEQPITDSLAANTEHEPLAPAPADAADGAEAVSRQSTGTHDGPVTDATSHTNGVQSPPPTLKRRRSSASSYRELSVKTELLSDEDEIEALEASMEQLKVSSLLHTILVSLANDVLAVYHYRQSSDGGRGW